MGEGRSQLTGHSLRYIIPSKSCPQKSVLAWPLTGKISSSCLMVHTCQVGRFSVFINPAAPWLRLGTFVYFLGKSYLPSTVLLL